VLEWVGQVGNPIWGGGGGVAHQKMWPTTAVVWWWGTMVRAEEKVDGTVEEVGEELLNGMMLVVGYSGPGDGQRSPVLERRSW
jgi:trehalose utilization protein